MGLIYTGMIEPNIFINSLISFSEPLYQQLNIFSRISILYLLRWWILVSNWIFKKNKCSSCSKLSVGMHCRFG
jgi:hypothetical protein